MQCFYGSKLLPFRVDLFPEGLRSFYYLIMRLENAGLVAIIQTRVKRLIRIRPLSPPFCH